MKIKVGHKVNVISPITYKVVRAEIITLRLKGVSVIDENGYKYFVKYVNVLAEGIQ